jgi:hypothetical protein
MKTNSMRLLSLALFVLAITPAFGDDVCPNIDRPATVVLNGCDSGVPNYAVPGACFISDEIDVCETLEAQSHGAFVSCVAHTTNALMKAGVITGEEKGRIMSCAGPKPQLL